MTERRDRTQRWRVKHDDRQSVAIPQPLHMETIDSRSRPFVVVVVYAAPCRVLRPRQTLVSRCNTLCFLLALCMTVCSGRNNIRCSRGIGETLSMNGIKLTHHD